MLASVDLTRLPTAKRNSQDISSTGDIEYSAREVAPAPLLVTQLIRANTLFLLHHAASLAELFSRVGRNTFCALLDRYWSKFVGGWDVLLHGNPLAVIYNATKLSGGGELGVGVGEEEWGSGEREVLEGFMDRTEGLRDLIVGRYGLPPGTDRPSLASKADMSTWLGTGNDPIAADGIIFSGRGSVSKRSLRTLSHWMESIFKDGNEAYGIGENPSSRPRRKRQRPRMERAASSGESTHSPEAHSRSRLPKAAAPNLRKQAMQNSTTSPGIPAPLVGQVERSLDDALAKALGQASREKTSRGTRQGAIAEPSSGENEPSMFHSENMMRYLKLGYGTAWTLNPKGLASNSTTERRSRKPRGLSAENNTTESSDAGLQEVDPTPDVSEDEQPFQQKLEQSIGKFLIGLSGDLEQAELDADDNETELPSSGASEGRLFLRTLTVEMSRPKHQKRDAAAWSSNDSQLSGHSASGTRKVTEPKTSAAASVDGAQPNITHEKVQVAVYVHQPFIFVFLFELHIPSLTMPSFYRSIHNQLGPLQRPLLRSTDPSRITERIAEATGEHSATSKASDAAHSTNPIYDLIYDPARLVVRTSIPNIPIPGSLAAEGLTSNASSVLSVSGSWYTLGIPVGSSTNEAGNISSEKLIKSAWSRPEALNAYTQLLHTFLATRSGNEKEHTVKTARGWWVLWMKLSQSIAEVNKRKNSAMVKEDDKTSISSTHTTKPLQNKEAFLVRKAADFRPAVTAQSRTLSSGPGKWLLREQKRDASGASTIGASASAKGVSEGVGVDAKKWVEGLLTLTQ